MEKWNEGGAYEQYDTLLQMGGRPTRSINPDPGVWDPVKVNVEEVHVLNHWSVESGRLQDELDRWRHFREFQQRNRAKPETFPRYQEHVLKYRQGNGIEGIVQLHLQPEEQTKLDEWKEYQFYEHRKLGRLQRIVKRAQETAESARNRFDAAESDESKDAIHDALLIYQGRLRSAELNVERLNELLDWIEGQFPLIISEGPVSSQETGGEGHHSRDQRELPSMQPTSKPTGLVASHSKTSKTIDQKSLNQKKQPSKVLGAVHSTKISKAVRKKPPRILQQRDLPRSAGSLPGNNRDEGLPHGATQPPPAAPRRSERIAERESNATSSDFTATSVQFSNIAGRKTHRRPNVDSTAPAFGKRLIHLEQSSDSIRARGFISTFRRSGRPAQDKKVTNLTSSSNLYPTLRSRSLPTFQSKSRPRREDGCHRRDPTGPGKPLGIRKTRSKRSK